MFNVTNEYFIFNHHHPYSRIPTSYYSINNQNIDYNTIWNKNEIHIGQQTDPPRGFKRRVSANKKERRRTQSINTAFSDLRTAIPNVQPDTKLSKIKTLKLATKYIEYLMNILSKDDPTLLPDGFKAEILKTRKEQIKFDHFSLLHKTKGRTGWPQIVWQTELNRHDSYMQS